MVNPSKSTEVRSSQEKSGDVTSSQEMSPELSQEKKTNDRREKIKGEGEDENGRKQSRIRRRMEME